MRYKWVLQIYRTKDIYWHVVGEYPSLKAANKAMNKLSARGLNKVLITRMEK